MSRASTGFDEFARTRALTKRQKTRLAMSPFETDEVRSAAAAAPGAGVAMVQRDGKTFFHVGDQVFEGKAAQPGQYRVVADGGQKQTTARPAAAGQPSGAVLDRKTQLANQAATDAYRAAQKRAGLRPTPGGIPGGFSPENVKKVMDAVSSGADGGFEQAMGGLLRTPESKQALKDAMPWLSKQSEKAQQAFMQSLADSEKISQGQDFQREMAGTEAGYRATEAETNDARDAANATAQAEQASKLKRDEFDYELSATQRVEFNKLADARSKVQASSDYTPEEKVQAVAEIDAQMAGIKSVPRLKKASPWPKGQDVGEHWTSPDGNILLGRDADGKVYKIGDTGKLTWRDKIAMKKQFQEDNKGDDGVINRKQADADYKAWLAEVEGGSEAQLPAAVAPGAEPEAVNSTTGQVLVYRNGQWQPK
jgi:hypothetical protein